MDLELLLPAPGFRIPTVAKMLGVSRATVYRYVEDGRLKSFEDFDGQMMVSKAEVIRFVERKQ